MQVPVDPPAAVAQPLSRTPSLPQGPKVPRGLAGARQETDTAGARPCSSQTGFTGGWGRHRDPRAQHGAEGEGVEVGSGGRVLIQQLMDPSMAGCLSVHLPGAGWLQVLGPRSGSGQGLGESWGETGASVSQALDLERARAAGPWGRGLPRPLPGELSGALPVTSAACKDVWGCCTLAMAALVPGRAAVRPRAAVPRRPRAHPMAAPRSPADTSRAQRQQSPRSRSSNSSRMARDGQCGGCLPGHRQGFKSSQGWRLVPVTWSVPQCPARSG